MYTRCSECKTIFRITRAHLNAARGQVRCGRCGTTFDALESLREELPDDADDLLESHPEPLVQAPDDGHRHDAPAPEPQPGFADIEPEIEPDMEPEPFAVTAHTPPRRWPWALAASVLTLVLAAQAVHVFRGELAEHESLGPWLEGAYALAGLELIPSDPPVELSAFALLHHEMISHPRLQDGLHLSGVLVNHADIPQPWPLLELRLLDRFGDTIAARRLAPAEYLRSAPQRDRVMPAGARRAIEVELLDPGHDAVGFRIDFCIELRAGMRCTSDRPAR